MTERATILIGPAGSGKTERLLGRFRQALRAQRQRPTALWIAPTWRLADDVRSRVLGGGLSGCFAPSVVTFSQLAAAILRASTLTGATLTDALKRQLVARLIREANDAGRIVHHAPIATSSGFVDLVSEFIADLKRWEVRPEEFLAAAANLRDRELGELYESYERLLVGRGLLDDEGRQATARRLLSQGMQPPFAAVELVIVDGFADFTRTQHEVLTHFARHVAELVISLPLEEPRERADLFGRPARTLEQLRRDLPDATIELLPRPATPHWPAVDHLERQLFRNPRRQTPADSAERIEIVAAPGELREIELVGRKIKEWLHVGDSTRPGRTVRPGEILVVFRTLATAAPLVREVFDEQGIPYSLEFGEPLERAPAVRKLLDLVSLAAEDWPFRGVLAVLGSNYFRPEWPTWQDGSARLAAERLVHQFRLPRGRRALLRRVQRQIERGPTPEQREWFIRWQNGEFNVAGESSDYKPMYKRGESPREIQERMLAAAEASLALPLLSDLGEMLDAIPDRATLAEWLTCLKALAIRSGWDRIVREAPDDQPGARLDREAWIALQEMVDAVGELDARLDVSAPSIARAEVPSRVLDLLRGRRSPSEFAETGRVRVLSAHAARGLRAPYLIVCGLHERGFPPPQREDRLFGDAEAREAIDARFGRPSATQTRNEEEMLLFYETVCRATHRLVLTYPALDAKAERMLPSPFLVEVDSAFGRDRDGRPKIARTELLDPSPLPPDLDEWHAEPAGVRRWRTTAVHELTHGRAVKLAAFARSEPQVGENLLAALSVEVQRSHRARFTRYEGLLDDDRIRAVLADEIANRRWSPHQLELYVACPFRYFVESVLKFAPLEDPELSTDFARRGQLLHDVLARLHHEQLDGPGDHDPLKLRHRYGELLVEQVGEHETDDPLERTLLTLDRKNLEHWGKLYLAQYELYRSRAKGLDAPMRPRHFEVSFGLAEDQAPVAEGLSIRQPLVLSRGDDQVLISGRIDRIDLGQADGRTVFNIVDYKTGARTHLSMEAVRAGAALQLPLYALAVQELLLKSHDAVAWQAGYWFIRDGGFPAKALTFHDREKGSLQPTDDWSEIRATVADRVFSAVAGVRSGKFPVFSRDDDCTQSCPYHTTCRVNHLRALGKTWPPHAPSP